MFVNISRRRRQCRHVCNYFCRTYDVIRPRTPAQRRACTRAQRTHNPAVFITGLGPRLKYQTFAVLGRVCCFICNIYSAIFWYLCILSPPPSHIRPFMKGGCEICELGDLESVCELPLAYSTFGTWLAVRNLQILQLAR